MQSQGIGFPNYISFYTLDTATRNFTAPINGWFIANIKNSRSSHIDLNISGYNAYIGRPNADDSHGRWFGLPIKKGQMLTWDFSGTVYTYFLPFTF